MGVVRTGDVKSQGRIQLPRSLADRIVFKHELHEECVQWHFDNDRNIAILSSQRDLQGFTYVKRSQVYGSPGQIRPPAAITDNLDSLENAEAVVYFSEEESEVYILFIPEDRLLQEIKEAGGLFQ